MHSYLHGTHMKKQKKNAHINAFIQTETPIYCLKEEWIHAATHTDTLCFKEKTAYIHKCILTHMHT